ncbi:MAG: hypothetical protein HC908_04295 [Calothrix sp. SM1_7_51]|nr:hypothetical protein [Calothrix sp. SM1_7_51]
MASQKEVKQYLAYWFQLGKKVVVGNRATTLQPHKIINGDRYSDEFEACWQQIIDKGSDNCYLEGTEETIAQLLNSTWEVVSCARCSMPVPVRATGMPSVLCPCNDLANWPNTELPLPRSPVNSQEHLVGISENIAKLYAPKNG